MANICVMGALLRPSKFEQRRIMSKRKQLKMKQAKVLDQTDVMLEMKPSKLPDQGDVTSEMKQSELRGQADVTSEMKQSGLSDQTDIVPEVKQPMLSDQTHVASENKQSGFSRQADVTSQESSACSEFLHEITDNFDLGLFRRVPFLFQSILNGILYGGVYCATVYIAPYAISVGLSDIKASFLMSALGASVCIMRLSPVVGYLVDKKIIPKALLTGIGFGINGIATISFGFITSYVGLMITSVVFGISIGTAGAVVIVICTDAAGSRDKAPGATAWLLLLCGVGSLIGILLTGM